MNKPLAVNVTTYNNPRALELCFESLLHQTDSNFELFISDDGSKDETRALIKRIQPRFFARKIPIHHHWHPDEGYRKAVINNVVFRRILPDDHPVTVCIDHDVICHARFLADHRQMHDQPRTLFMGRRVELGPKISAALKPRQISRFIQGPSMALLKSFFTLDTPNIGRAFRIESPALIRLLGREKVDDLLGSNFSISTALLHEINGYDEDFLAYWGEDGDLFVRARNSGARLIGRKGYAIQFHLDHPRLEPDAENLRRYEELLNRTDYRVCAKGIRR